MLDFLRRRALQPGEQKRSRTAPLIAWHDGGRARWTPRDYAALGREGYQKNPVAHRCVRLIAEAPRNFPSCCGACRGWTRGGATGRWRSMPIPALDLIPSPITGRAAIAFPETLYSHLCVARERLCRGRGSRWGVARTACAAAGSRQRGAGPDGWPQAWDYTVRGRSCGSAMTGRASTPILHLSLFHPLDDHYGLSPLEAAAQSLDIHNGASVWNKAAARLDNAARPSGALVYAGGDGSALTDQQFERLKAELEDSFQGVRNAGRPLLLEGGLDWKPLSLTAEGQGFHRREGSGRARHRARLRRAAADARPAGGCHARQLRRAHAPSGARR